MDFKRTLILRAVSFWQAPLVFFLGPIVEECTTESVKVRIRLRFRTKNPVGSMFFGALTSGADIAGSLAAYFCLRQTGGKVSILFKDMDAKFLKKATGDVIFSCQDARAIQAALRSTLASGEKVELPVNVVAYLAKDTKQTPIATFRLTLSMKRYS